jgi:hypothetical protein
MYGVLKPVSAPAAPRRSVTITGELMSPDLTPRRPSAYIALYVERRDPALIRARSVKRPAKTFDDFLPSEYITNAEDSSSAPDSPRDDITRANRNRALPKIPRIVEAMRPRAISPRASEDDDKHYLLNDDHSASPTSYATHDDEKELSRSNSNASFLSLPIIDTHMNLSI